MKRLTKRYPTHIEAACDNCVKQDELCDLAWCYERLLKRLADYEDTGFEPEEITEADKILKENWQMPLERLKEGVELINKKDAGLLSIDSHESEKPKGRGYRKGAQVGVIELIGELFELWATQNWLKHIDRAVDEYNRLNKKARMQAHVVHKLVARYNEIYPENKIDVWRKEGRA